MWSALRVSGIINALQPPSFKHGQRLAQKGGVGMFLESLLSLVLCLIPQVLANLISDGLIKWIHKEDK